MTSKNIYKIGKIHQLFDLNNDIVNFTCDFRITAESKDQNFEYLIISQSQLDNDDDLPNFNKAKGVGVGRVESTHGQHENYFLALKSNSDIKVQVETHFQDLSSMNIPQQPQQPQ